MLKLRSLLRQMRLGIAVTALIVAGTALWVRRYGPLYGVWGWPELVLGGLFLAAALMAGAEALMRQPNPYSRTYALYNLRDLPPTRPLESGGTGWMIQALPSVLTAIALSSYFLLT